MNIIDLQERLKDLPENALMQEMQTPTGTAPQFLVLSELKRRKRMRDDYQRQQAQGMQTVAEEAVTAAGMPQEGIMGLAQGMAPRSAIAQDTGVNDMMQQDSVRAPQPEQPMMMADGGYTRLMNRRERMNDSDSAEDPGMMRRFLENIKERIRAGRMTDEEAKWLIDNYGIIPDALNPIYSGMDAINSAKEGDYAGAALNTAATIPSLKLPGMGMNALAELYNRFGDKEVEPVRQEDISFGGFPKGMAAGGVLKMQPGGFTDRLRRVQEEGYLAFLNIMNLQDSPESREMYAQYGQTSAAAGGTMPDETRARLDLISRMTDPDSSFRNQLDQFSAGLADFGTQSQPMGEAPQGIASVSADVSSFLPGMPGMPGADSRPTMMTAPPVLGAAPTADGIDFDASAGPSVTQSRVSPTREMMKDGALDPRLDMVPGSALFKQRQQEVDAFNSRQRERDRVAQAQSNAGLSNDPYTFDAFGNIVTDPDEIARIQYAQEQALPYPGEMPPPYVIPDGGLARVAEGLREVDPYTGGSRLPEPPVEDQNLSFGLDGMDIPGSGTSLSFGDVTSSAADIPFSMGEPVTGEPIPDLSLGEPILDPAATPPVRDTGSGGAGGSGAGGFGPIESRIARMLEEREKSAEADKWLSLAQTGLALMASDQPTLGGAIGEAGLAGIGAMQQARSQYDKDIMGLLDMQAGIQRARSAGARSTAPKVRTPAELNAALDYLNGIAENQATVTSVDEFGKETTIKDYSRVSPTVQSQIKELEDRYLSMLQGGSPDLNLVQ